MVQHGKRNALLRFVGGAVAALGLATVSLAGGQSLDKAPRGNAASEFFVGRSVKDFGALNTIFSNRGASESRVESAAASRASGLWGMSSLRASSSNSFLVDVAVKLVTLSPATVTGGESSICTVKLNKPAGPGGAHVELVATKPAVTSVPAFLDFAEGDMEKSFTIRTAPRDVSTTSTIKATFPATTTKKATLTINSADLKGFNISKKIAYGGSGSGITGLVSLNGPAGPSGVTVTLSSDKPAVASVPASVFIPAGGDSATFPVTHHVVTTTESVQLSAGVGQTVVTAPLLEVRPWVVTAFELSPNAVKGGVGSTGTVELNAPAPAGGVVIPLTKSSSKVTCPASVTINEGETLANFPVTTTTVTSTIEVKFTATFLGVIYKTSLFVDPILLIKTLKITPSTAIGGSDQTMTGEVVLFKAAPAGGTTIDIATSDAHANVPATVLVPAGLKNVTFPISTNASPTTVTPKITASAQGTIRSKFVTVYPGLPTGVSVLPTTTIGGSSTTVTGTVQLNGPAPAGGVTVNLSSSDTNAATVPATVTVTAGSSSKTFTVTHKAIAATTNVTITAMGLGTSFNTSLEVKAVALTNLTLNNATVKGGTATSITGTVTLDLPAPVGGTVVTLSSSDTNAATVPATVTVPSGATTANFAVTHKAVNADTTTTIKASLFGVDKTADLLVQTALMTGLTITPSSVIGGNTATGKITLDGPAGPAGKSVTVTSDLPGTATCSSPVVVPAGATEVTFTITTFTIAGATRTVVFTATLAGVTKTANLKVTSR